MGKKINIMSTPVDQNFCGSHGQICIHIRSWRNMAVGKGGAPVAEGINGDDPAAFFLYLFDNGNQSDLCGCRVPAPEDHGPGVVMVQRVMGDAGSQVQILGCLAGASAQ